MVKSRKFFFVFKVTTSALEVKFFSFWSNLGLSRPYVCSAWRKKLCFCVFQGLYWSPIWQPWVWEKLLFWKYGLERVLNSVRTQLPNVFLSERCSNQYFFVRKVPSLNLAEIAWFVQSWRGLVFYWSSWKVLEFGLGPWKVLEIHNLVYPRHLFL